MKNGGKNKSVAFIILFSVYIVKDKILRNQKQTLEVCMDHQH